MTRPLIGITTELAAAIWRDRIRETVLSPAACSGAVERAGGTAVLLPPVLPTAGRSQLEHGAQLERSAAQLVRALDGLVFRAGPQAALGESWTADQPSRPDLASTAPQAALIKAALDAGIPFLAIGAGALTLNLVTGGTLDSADNGSANVGQEVRVGPGKLEQILGSSITVPVTTGPVTMGPPARGPRTTGQVSAVRLGQLGSSLTAVAWSGNGHVLAVEATAHPFGIGVSWQSGEDDDIRLLAALCAAATQDQRQVTQPVS